MRTTLTTLALAASLTLGISGCVVVSHDGDHGMMSDSNDQSANAMDMNDIMFAQMMIPHHEQAVELATLAESNTTTVAVLDLAARIKAAQAPEIELMKGWLDDAGVGESMMDDMPMQGIVGDADMDKLRAARGKAFDRLFLTRMIAHHEGAIVMAKNVLGTSENANVETLAHNIIDSQTAEIAEMKGLLGKG